MRLWSVHPQHLDRQGLVAVWREGLLAQRVLAGGTRGYRHHPQLRRFREVPSPGVSIITYLHGIADEAARRGYSFDRGKILGPPDSWLSLEVSTGQLAYEWARLRAKLAARSPEVLARWADVELPEVHPIFIVVPGPIASWEIVTPPR